VYDGAVVSEETLAPNDARILLRTPSSPRKGDTVAELGDTPRLREALPNPFNPRTHIAFALSRPEHVQLRLYDVSGRLLRTLVDAPRRAGEHLEVWDGRDANGQQVASGVYICALAAGGARSTLKLVRLD
jgi:hypothetical protein